MDADIRAFGNIDEMTFSVTLAQNSDMPGVALNRRRTLWFDRDVDGSWLVWVAGPDDNVRATTEVGAIAVRNATVAAFLEQLGHLLAFPDHFAHEPRFDGDGGTDGQTTQRGRRSKP